MTLGSTDFCYKPLENKSTIRLVHLLAESTPTDIRCEIEHRDDYFDNSIDSGYTALSYCWGDPSVTETITLDGVEFKVTHNLWHALSNFVQHHNNRTTGYYWIDALCINQDDVDERNEQVYQMWSIYANASEVFVWLGTVDDSTATAYDLIDLFNNTSAAEDRDAVNAATEPTPPPLSSDQRSPVQGEDGEEEPFIEPLLGASSLDVNSGMTYHPAYHTLPDHGVVAVLKLCARPYFSRAWIVLEFTQARSLQFLCGKYYCNAAPFDWLMDRSEMRRYAAGTAAVRELFRAREAIAAVAQDGALAFIDILDSLASRGCSDRRDRIFACIGDRRTKGLDHVAQIRPDYNLSVEELAVEVIVYFDRLRENDLTRAAQDSQDAAMMEATRWGRTAIGHNAVELLLPLSKALGLPRTPQMFFAHVAPLIEWSRDGESRDFITMASGRQIQRPGETARHLLHPDYGDRRDSSGLGLSYLLLDRQE